ncbi:MAG: YceD family protein [Dissulfurimicrobium sp.]|uniref:YceD family protein n=1 Tax=Dissulfurimicrobium TaxID=1769732 RepID=UPI003C78FC24
MDKITYPDRYLISIEDIPEEGLCVHCDNVSNILSDQDDPALAGPVGADVCLNRVDGLIYLQGSVKAAVNLVCDRCLNPYQLDIDAAFSYLLIPQSLEKEGFDAAAKGKDAEILTYNGKDVPFGEILREQILLQIPFRRLCNDGCKGICPSCGADLNKEACHCEKDIKQGPFTVLKGLKMRP